MSVCHFYVVLHNMYRYNVNNVNGNTCYDNWRARENTNFQRKGKNDHEISFLTVRVISYVLYFKLVDTRTLSFKLYFKTSKFI